MCNFCTKYALVAIPQDESLYGGKFFQIFEKYVKLLTWGFVVLSRRSLRSRGRVPKQTHPPEQSLYGDCTNHAPVGRFGRDWAGFGGASDRFGRRLDRFGPARAGCSQLNHHCRASLARIPYWESPAFESLPSVAAASVAAVSVAAASSDPCSARSSSNSSASCSKSIPRSCSMSFLLRSAKRGDP